MSSVSEKICREVLRLAPREVYSVRPYLDRVVTDEHVVYVKHGSAAETGGRFGLEAWAYRTCRANGVLVPDVLAAPGPDEELDYIATTALAGRALWAKPYLSGASLKRVLRAAGEQLRAMHEIHVDGFGPIVPGVGSRPRAGHARWCPYVDIAQGQALRELVDSGALSGDEAESIRARLAEAEPALRRGGSGRLLHGDLEGDHIFSYRARFTGFIDFEKMQAGDPCYDLARLGSSFVSPAGETSRGWCPRRGPAAADARGRPPRGPHPA